MHIVPLERNLKIHSGNRNVFYTMDLPNSMVWSFQECMDLSYIFHSMKIYNYYRKSKSIPFQIKVYKISIRWIFNFFQCATLNPCQYELTHITSEHIVRISLLNRRNMKIKTVMNSNSYSILHKLQFFDIPFIRLLLFFLFSIP